MRETNGDAACGIEGVGLRAVSALGPFRAVELDHDLAHHPPCWGDAVILVALGWLVKVVGPEVSAWVELLRSQEGADDKTPR